MWARRSTDNLATWMTYDALFFFFQAEDGIRDHCVTGVQTCALPISFAEAASFGEVAVLATLWSGTENAIRLAEPKNLAGKVVIDATNPLVFKEGAPPALPLGFSDSGGEQVQRWLPASRVVKAFNIVGNQFMVNPQFPCGPPDMFICGNDDGAKKTVTDFLKAFGWPVVDIGGIEGARLLEPLCILSDLY